MSKYMTARMPYYLATCDGESGLQVSFFATKEELDAAEVDAVRNAANEYGDGYWDSGEVPLGPSRPALPYGTHGSTETNHDGPEFIAACDREIAKGRNRP